MTHSLHYGSAVFEGIRVYETDNGPAIFRLSDHIKRLFFSASVVMAKIPFSQKDIEGMVLELVRKNKLKSGYIRPIIYYGDKMGLDPNGANVHIAIACWSWGKYLEKDSVKIKISKYIRIHPESSVMEAKISGHYANSILATTDAKKSGYDEALLLDWRGNIAEGPGENIFFVKGKNIYTPAKGSILPGITRDTIIKLAKDSGYKVFEKNIKPIDVRKFDEAFFTGTAVEINAIGQIDKIKIGDVGEGKTVKKLKDLYFQTVHGKIRKYNKWLSLIN